MQVNENKTGKNNRPTRILYIADSTSIHTQRWLRYFSNRGYDVYLITIGRKRQTLPYARHVINFDQFYYDSPSFIPTLFKTRQLIRSIRPDILHAHFVHQYGWLGALSGFHPFVLTAWGTDILKLPYASRSKLGKWLTQYALKKADVITTTSSAARNEAILLGADEKKTEVIFWGVDTHKFKQDIDTRVLRKRLSIPENALVVLSNRNCNPLYNIDIIIEAMACVLRQYPESILILQNIWDGSRYESELKRLVSEKGIEQSVRFLPQYEHEEIPPLYALADVYVTVPSWDAGPVSLKEAMASHCAPIISEVPGPMEWVRHEENGLVVPVRDVDKLSKAILDLLVNKEKRLRFNQINRKIIIEKAEHTVQMRKVDKIYKRIINAF